MASRSIDLGGSPSALVLVDDSAASSLFGEVARLDLVDDVAGDSWAALARAGAAIARVEREVGRLWRDSMRADDPAMSQRLAEVSHTLLRAARMLERNGSIG